MKNVLKVSVIILVTLMFLGCSTTYTIRTKDGQEYTSQGEPDLTDDNFVKFETTGGRKVLIKQDEVSTIQEN